MMRSFGARFTLKRQSWGKAEIVLFLERLELYITSGLSIDRSLGLCAVGLTEKRSSCVTRIMRSVESGSRLSVSLSEAIRFPESVIGIVRQGESSGNLSTSLSLSRRLLESGEELKKKCLSAMVYPTVIGIFSVLLTVGLVRGVMPQIIPMLGSLHVELPILTRIVMAVSEIFLAYGYPIAIVFALCVSVVIFSYRRFPSFRYVCHKVVSVTPLLGSLVGGYHLSIFLETCGSLIEAGLPVAKAYGDAVTTVSFLPLRGLLYSKTAEVERGTSLGLIMDGKAIPSFISPLLLAGESSGNLGRSAMRASSIIDRDMEHSLKRLTALIEPVMMIGMGLTVGSIALSIMMPIYDISKVLQH